LRDARGAVATRPFDVVRETTSRITMKDDVGFQCEHVTGCNLNVVEEPLDSQCTVRPDDHAGELLTIRKRTNDSLVVHEVGVAG
jgi:hypothetical protein